MGTRTKAAPAAPAAPARSAGSIQAAGLARLQERRRPPEYGISHGTGIGGADKKIPMSMNKSEFLAAVDLPQWLDDQILRLPLAEPYDLTIRVLEALRTSEDTAVAMIGEAKALSTWNQWAMWCYLTAPVPPVPPAGHPDPLGPLRREWVRRGLATERSDEGLRTVTLNQDELDESRRRKHRGRGLVTPAGVLPAMGVPA
jgi:hypothetical protein